MPKGYFPGRNNWTREEELRLAEMLDNHRPYAEIAAVLGRTVTAIRLRCKRRGLPALSKAGGMTINKTARLLGVPCAKTVTRWCNEGWLRSHDVGMQLRCGRVRVVEMDDLLGFLEKPKYWHLWEPERITDSGIREWAIEMRQGVRFLTAGEVAKRLCYSMHWVNELIRRGKIRAVRRGNWLVRECDCRHPEPQSSKGRKRAPGLTEAECRIVRRYWGKRPAAEITRLLGRSAHSKVVYNAAARMGLPKLGKGCWKRVKAPKRRAS